MEHTAGLGREAQIWLGGDLLTVCDSISEDDSPCLPGVLEDQTLDVDFRIDDFDSDYDIASTTLGIDGDLDGDVDGLGTV